MVDQDRLFETLRRFAESMSVGYELSDVLYHLGDDVTGVLGITGAGIAIVDEDGTLRYASATSDDVVRLELVQEEHQAGPCAEAVRTQGVVTVADIATRPDWAAYRKEAESLGIRAVAGLPLSVGGEHLGALNLYDSRPRQWSDGEIDAARILADMAAGFMLHPRVQEARLRAEQLQGALDSRVLLEQAKGILAGDLHVTLDEAFELLRRHSRNNNTSLRVIAQAVITDGFRPPST